MTEAIIESAKNPRVKAWKALRTRKERDRTGTFLIEGERETMRAAEHLELAVALVREDRTDIEIPDCVVLSDRAFDSLSARENPDGVAGVFRTPSFALTGIDPSSTDLVLIADGIEKPGNTGAMIRTADAFGAGVVGSSLTSDLVNPNTIRAAQGSLSFVPLAADDREPVQRWATANYRVAVMVPDGGTALWDIDLTPPTAVVVGSEHAGVDASWRDHGEPVTIPMVGRADSLNTSVAAAVVLAEAQRQRSA